jgi:hypothetical protein
MITIYNWVYTQFKDSQYEKSLYEMIIITFEKTMKFTKFRSIAVNGRHDYEYFEVHLVLNFGNFSEFLHLLYRIKMQCSRSLSLSLFLLRPRGCYI